MEHRLGQRHSTHLHVSMVSQHHATLHGEIVNISTGGAFIKLQTDSPAPRGIVRINFVLPRPEQQVCKHRALIVHRSKHGIGVMFDRRQELAFAHRTPKRPAFATTSAQPESAPH